VYFENIMRSQADVPLRTSYGLFDDEEKSNGTGPYTLFSTPFSPF
jgi:hypothetical protein